MSSIILSPIGFIKISATNIGISRIEFLGREKQNQIEDNNKFICELKKQIIAYFTGELTEFNIPLDIVGTKFEKSVWSATMLIDFGKTATYLDIAKYIGKEKSYRAVGNALGKNPIPIIVPCHRVVAKNGLGGFSSPLYIKKYLLEFERNHRR